MSNIPASRRSQRYTYADYRTWPEGERWELIDGQAWNMSPAPSWGHQELVGLIFTELSIFLKGKPCRPFVAPVDIFLPKADGSQSDLDSVDTIVQPDLGAVCDRSKINPRGIIGAPDLVMEILSPSSFLRDVHVKKDLYGRHGCREYWIWDARVSMATRYVRQESGTWDDGKTFDPSQVAESVIFPGFKLSLPDLRAEMGIKD